MRESAFVRPRRRRSSARRQAILSDDPQWHVRWPRVALTAREVHGEPIFICGRVETHHAEGFRHAFRNPFLRPIRVMQPQWFGNGSADPPTRIQRAEWALEHQSAATPQFAGDFALHRLAEIRNLARFSVFEPQQYSCKGGFADPDPPITARHSPERTSISTSCST